LPLLGTSCSACVLDHQVLSRHVGGSTVVKTSGTTAVVARPAHKVWGGPLKPSCMKACVQPMVSASRVHLCCCTGGACAGITAQLVASHSAIAPSFKRHRQPVMARVASRPGVSSRSFKLHSLNSCTSPPLPSAHKTLGPASAAGAGAVCACPADRSNLVRTQSRRRAARAQPQRCLDGTEVLLAAPVSTRHGSSTRSDTGRAHGSQRRQHKGGDRPANACARRRQTGQHMPHAVAQGACS
jgi:hypothetical protein